MRTKLLAFISTIAVVTTLTAGVPAMALSSSASGATDNSVAAAASSAELTRLKSRGDAEISRRLTSLNKLGAVINSTAKLSAGDKNTLSSQVSGEVSNLTALKTQLDGETTLAAAQNDAQSIATSYRVYALIVPKVYLLKGADTELVNNTKLSTLAGKLQDRITTAKGQGKNVTGLQTTLDDMNSKINDGKNIATAVETKVAPLQPTDYDSDHTVLQGQRSQLQTAHQDNVTAYGDAKTLAGDLKSL